MNHHRGYDAALAVLAAFAALSAGMLLFLAGSPAGGSLDPPLPRWSLPWVAMVNLAYLIAISITLWARRYRPATGRALTRALNWALLPAVPGGTVVGLYGLLRAEERRT